MKKKLPELKLIGIAVDAKEMLQRIANAESRTLSRQVSILVAEEFARRGLSLNDEPRLSKKKKGSRHDSDDVGKAEP